MGKARHALLIGRGLVALEPDVSMPGRHPRRLVYLSCFGSTKTSLQVIIRSRAGIAAHRQ